MKFVPFIIGLSLISQHAYAVDIEQLLESEQSEVINEKSDHLEVKVKNKESAVSDEGLTEVTERSAPEGDRLNQQKIVPGVLTQSGAKHEIIFGLGSAFEQFETLGAGSIVLPMKQSRLLLEGAYSLQLDQSLWGAYATAKRWSTQFSDVQGAVPSRSQAVTWQYQGGAKYLMGSGVGIRFGYFYQTRKADETRPVIISTISRHGPEVGLDYNIRLPGDFVFVSHTQLQVPVFYKEMSASSGSHVLTVVAQAGLGFRYEVSKFVDIGFMPWIRYEYARFTGSSPRGFTDANERNLTVGLPLQLVVKMGGT